MTCQRTHDLDLLGFLENPARADFEAFRDHYPRCADCAAEVRAFTELRAQLRGSGDLRHPEPEVLVRWDSERQTLDEGLRRSVAHHLDGCAACRDELRALRAFSPTALQAPAVSESEPTPTRHRSEARDRGAHRRNSPLRSLGRLLWHPAFAYALAGLLLLPTIYRTVATPGVRSPLELRRQREVLYETQPDLVGVAPRSEPAAPVDDLEQEEAVFRKALAPEVAKRIAPAEDAEHLRASTTDLDESQAGTLRSLGYLEDAPAPRARMRPMGRGATALGRADATQKRETEPASARSPESPSRAPAMAQTTGSLASPAKAKDSQHIVAASDAAAGFALSIPWPASPHGSVAVRITSDDGGRELRDVLTARPGATGLRLEIPPGWLRAGRHTLVAQAGDQTVTFLLIVEAPEG